MSDSGPAMPLLTLAIPTYNRGGDLSTLLEVLLPQLEGHPEVDLFISDNCSPDDTEAIVAGFVARGLQVRYRRHAENIGSDRNFLYCFNQARGNFFWMCGDDDVILPGALERVLEQLRRPEPLDLLYVTNYGFRENWERERVEDRFNRSFHTYTDAREFAKVVHIMFTFISSIVVNRERLLELPREPPEALLSTNLVQLGWCLPLLCAHRRSVVIWERSVAGRQGNAGGYAIGRVFGSNLGDCLSRLLPGRQDLQRSILNMTVRRWLPTALYANRAQGNERLGLATAEQDLYKAFGGNFRYWLFAYPVLKLPLAAARLWMRAGTALNMAIYVLTVPGFWRRQT